MLAPDRPGLLPRSQASQQQAARDLTAAVAVGALYIDTGQLSALDEIAEAYGHVDAGTRVRILINIARYRDAPQKYQSETGSHHSPSKGPSDGAQGPPRQCAMR